MTPLWKTHQGVRRLWMPAVSAFLFILLALSAAFGVAAVRHHNLEIAVVGARNIFQMAVVTRKWNAAHGGVYVPVTRDTEPNPYLDHPRRDIADASGRSYTLVNPAFMTRQIAELAEKQAHFRIHITSLRPIRSANQADPWESAALLAFERGTAEHAEVTRFEEGKFLRYMAPLKVDEACMTCHEKQGYKVGDIRGGISVSLPYGPIAAAMSADIRWVLLSHLFFGGMGIVVSLALLELLRRRWKALDDAVLHLQETRDELVRSEKMASLGRLVAGFAHEINTPVGIAVNAISKGEEAVHRLESMITRDEVSEEELRRPLDELREAQRLALANLQRGAELLTRFKRTAVHQGEVAKRPFDLAEVICDVLACLRGELKRRPIYVDVQCPEGITIHGTPGLFEQLLTNLITNSIRHGFDDGRRAGRIEIEVRPDPGRRVLRIDFADDGAGIAPQVRDRIFEPFLTTRRAEGGSGLGLFIVYSIVTRQLGGTIECSSSPGEGTRFRIELPHPGDDAPAGDTP